MYLEQAHDRAYGVRKNKDIYVKLPWIDSDIVGFDSISILRSDDFVEPRRLQLYPPVRQWLKFAEQIDSINIFGQEFGTLIELSPQTMPDTPGTCPQTIAPEEYRDSLVAPLAVLKAIAEPHRHTLNSIQLAPDLYWHNISESFCACDSQPCRRLSVVKLQSKPVKGEPGIKRDHPIFDTHAQGAIIFDQGDHKAPESEVSSVSVGVHSGESSRTSVSPVSTRTSESSGSHGSSSMKSVVWPLLPKKWKKKKKTDETE